MAARNGTGGSGGGRTGRRRCMRAGITSSGGWTLSAARLEKSATGVVARTRPSAPRVRGLPRGEERFPFRLRGAEGSVTVSFQANEDPQRWGYGVLGLTWPIELAQGLPVLTARTECALDGYAAVMGWVQIVRIEVHEASRPLAPGVDKAPVGQHEWVDGPPQLRGLGVPFTSFGECPTLFDAPASTESDTTFLADSWLTASPDALISRESCPGSRPSLGLLDARGRAARASRAGPARRESLGRGAASPARDVPGLAVQTGVAPAKRIRTFRRSGYKTTVRPLTRRG